MRYQLDTSGGAPPLLIAQIELAVSQLARALGADTLGGILADVLVTSERHTRESVKGREGEDRERDGGETRKMRTHSLANQIIL